MPQKLQSFSIEDVSFPSVLKNMVIATAVFEIDDQIDGQGISHFIRTKVRIKCDPKNSISELHELILSRALNLILTLPDFIGEKSASELLGDDEISKCEQRWDV